MAEYSRAVWIALNRGDHRLPTLDCPTQNIEECSGVGRQCCIPIIGKTEIDSKIYGTVLKGRAQWGKAALFLCKCSFFAREPHFGDAQDTAVCPVFGSFIPKSLRPDLYIRFALLSAV